METQRIRKIFNRKNIGAIGAVSFIVIGLIGVYLTNTVKRKSNVKFLGANKDLVLGRVESLTIVHVGSTYFINYSYTVDSVEYTDSRSDFCWSPAESDRIYFEGKEFPVIYEIVNPKNNRMLMGKYEFEKYNLPFPIELKSVSDRFFNCRK